MLPELRALGAVVGAAGGAGIAALQERVKENSICC
jgi:hypothetical protein